MFDADGSTPQPKPRARPRGSDAILIRALSSGATHAQAAQQAGVSIRTVGRRCADPEFQAQLEAVQHQARRRIATALTAGTEEAIATLRDLNGPGAPNHIRLGAARTLLDTALRVADLETRDQLDALQAQLSAATERFEQR